jgi:phosphatidylinositol glycan class V
LTPNPTNPSLSGKVNTSAILTPQHILLSPHPSFLPLPQCVPFILISLLTTTILLLNSHVQIALRLAQTLPVFYWGAAQLILAKPSAGSEVEMETKEGEGEGKGQMSGWGKIYVRWVVSWSLVATVLWGGFYPPA